MSAGSPPGKWMRWAARSRSTRTGSAADAASRTSTGSAWTGRPARAATRSKAATPFPAAMSGRPLRPGRRHDRDADRLALGHEPAGGLQERVEERLVAGLELAATVERDGPGHGHGRVTHRPLGRRAA